MRSEFISYLIYQKQLVQVSLLQTKGIISKIIEERQIKMIDPGI